MRRQPSEWEKIFANKASDKGTNHQNILVHTAQYHKNTQPDKKWAEDTK